MRKTGHKLLSLPPVPLYLAEQDVPPCTPQSLGTRGRVWAAQWFRGWNSMFRTMLGVS